jgi:beta-phosphoglucomutase-like phosphatase (HAD superfamily)
MIVFDFDGVLVDSEPVKARAFERIFSRYPEHAARMSRFVAENPSMPRAGKLKYLVEECLGRRGDTGLLARLLAEFSAETLEGVCACPEIEGAREFLEQARGTIPLYLASVTPLEDLTQILRRRGLLDYFKLVYGDPPTAKADAIRDALQRERCEPARALLIGDSIGDYHAAAQTGVRFLRYGTPPALPDESETFSDWTMLGELLMESAR